MNFGSVTRRKTWKGASTALALWIGIAAARLRGSWKTGCAHSADRISLSLAIVCMWLGWTGVAEAQPLYDVGKQELSSEQISTLRMRQRVLQTLDVGVTNSLVIAMETVAAQDTTVVLRNEETGRNVVLSGFLPGCREAALPPLLLAELKAGALGAARRYSYTVLESASNGTTTVKNQAGFAMPDYEIKLPVFNYGPADAIKTTAIEERTVVGVGRAKPHFIPADDDDPALAAKTARMEEEGAYYVYTYQLPDGTLATHDELAQSAEPLATTIGSLTFQVSASGSTAAQDVANAFTTGLWGAVLSGPVPVTVSIAFSDFGVGNENVIGQSWDPAVYKSGSIYYPSALRNQKVGYDINRQMSDIRLEFNTRHSFYYGTNGICPTGQIDYPSVLLHEICHGLGFYSSISSSTGQYGTSPSTPLIYDTFLYYNGARLAASTAAARVTALTNGALYWDGPNAVAANGGSRIKIYAPASYQPGSSTSHWDDSVSFPTFMKYAYHGVVHTFNTRKLGLMKDLGWTLASETVTPAPPGTVIASDDLADKVRVTWTISTNATSYKIYRNASSSNASASQIGTSTSTSYDDLTAVSNTPYYYWVKAANGAGTSGFGPSDTGLRISPATALATALDTTDLTWSTGGNANWYLQSTVTHDGMDAARSGAITNGQATWLKTTVTGPGTLGYWARVSSQLPMFGDDTLSFEMDGSAADPGVGGEADWTFFTRAVFLGEHELVWKYTKDGFGSAGMDCAWLDQVTFIPISMEQQVVGFPAAGGDSNVTVANGQTNEISIRALEDCPAWLSDLVVRNENTNTIDFGRAASTLIVHGASNELSITAYPNATASARSWMVEVLWPGGGKQLLYSQEAGPVSPKVTFDPAGGVVSPEFLNVTYGLAYGPLPLPVRDPYVFGGWWTAGGDAGLEVTESTPVTNAADQTLVARWSMPPNVILSFDIGNGLLTATNGRLSLRAVATGNATVIWDTSTNLLQWEAWQTNALTNGIFDTQAPIGTNEQQFFRLRIP